MSDYSTPAASDFACLPTHTIVTWHILALNTFPLPLIPFCPLLEQFLTNKISLVYIYTHTHTHTHTWYGYNITGLMSTFFYSKDYTIQMLSPSMYSPLQSLQRSMRIFHCWKQCCRSSSDNLFMSSVAFAFTAWTDSNLVPFNADLIFGNYIYVYIYIYILYGFSGLGVACWPLVPKFAGSNPAEAFGFLGLPIGFFLSDFPSKTPYTPSPHPYAPHAQPISFMSVTNCLKSIQVIF